MKSILFILLAIQSSSIIAGLYGAIHNQISFTVSPEYFTVFKFYQFNMFHVYDRLGAAIVGVMASWWVGCIAAVIIVPFSFCYDDTKIRLLMLFKAFSIIIFSALFVGLLALLWAYYFIDDDYAPHYQVPNGVTDRRAFLQAACMHNHSYLGAFIGVFVAIWYLRHCRRFLQQETPNE